MKITFLIQSLQFAGSEKVAFDLIKHYRGRNIECSLVTLLHSTDRDGRALMLKELQAMKVPVVELNKRSGLRNAVDILRQLNKAIIRFNPDFIHAHGNTPNVYAGIRNLLYTKKFTITTLHSGGDDWVRKKDRILEKISLYGVNKIVSVAEHVASFYQSRFKKSKGKVVVIENGVDRDKFPAITETEKRKLREDLGVEEGCPLLINVARIDPVKNQSFLIEVAQRLKQRRQRFTMLFVGNLQDQGYAEQLGERIRECGLEDRVRLLGSRNDVYRLLQISELFLFPSQFEASPLALLEAIYSGLPAICSNIQANRRLSQLDKRICIADMNADQWADHVMRKLESTGENGLIDRDTMQRRISFDRVADDYLALCSKS